MMDPKVKAKFLEALRSGEYAQGVSVSERVDPHTSQKFQSGQVFNGLFEFDGSEVFILENGTQVQLVGQVPIGSVIRLQRSGNLGQSKFQVVGRRKEGQKLVLQCERLPGSNDVFSFVRYRGLAKVPGETWPKEVDVVAGVEAIERAIGGNCPTSYRVRIQGVPQWVDAIECVSANDPYLTGRNN